MKLVVQECPNFECTAQTDIVIAKGFYRRKVDGRKIQRFRCKACGKSFSKATKSLTYRQHKPYLNSKIGLDLCSGISQRRIARRLQTTRKTVARKLRILGQQAREDHAKELLSFPKSEHIQFDDMETSEHTKLKPLAIPLVVENKSRRILAWGVGSMPAKGHLAKRSVKKYGRRKDSRPELWNQVLATVKPIVAEGVTITTDSHPRYEEFIRKNLPTAIHKRVKGRRGCVVGQGELKRGGFDPIFSLNHTAAMLRANINRLFRRTWCTTKRPDALSDHIAIYVRYHNTVLIKNPSR